MFTSARFCGQGDITAVASCANQVDKGYEIANGGGKRFKRTQNCESATKAGQWLASILILRWLRDLHLEKFPVNWR
jgi:hypothetical protein